MFHRSFYRMSESSANLHKVPVSQDRLCGFYEDNKPTIYLQLCFTFLQKFQTSKSIFNIQGYRVHDAESELIGQTIPYPAHSVGVLSQPI